MAKTAVAQETWDAKKACTAEAMQADFSYAPGETRTPNLLIRSQMLYPIELRAPIPISSCSERSNSNVEPDGSIQHAPPAKRKAPLLRMGGTRLELVTSTMSTWRSNQLS